MTSWPTRPIFYEINTWAWLTALGRRDGRQMTLGNVPDQDWDDLAEMGIDAVWLMGVWERSPAGKAIALADEGIRADLHRTLSDFSSADLAGSPYCIRRYVVDDHLGGPKGLAVARSRLSERGIRLLLDFVPNHVAPDHPWTQDHLEYFITGSAAEYLSNPLAYLEVAGRPLARGRDPFFPAWPDVLQLNTFLPALRRAAADTLSRIAGQCDGVRCDMAMLVLNDVFEKTWGRQVGSPPVTDYWNEVIGAVRERFPDFIFLAEAYWDREWDLQQQGFDYCYDKRLYDRLVGGDVREVRRHLEAEATYQDRLVRFLENHDEQRAATVFPSCRSQAAAVITATLPGAKLFHEGQFTGCRVRLPVFLSRRPDEEAEETLHLFYQKLLAFIRRPALRDGGWRLCDVSGWPDNRSHENILAWQWSGGNDPCLVVVNYSDHPAQGRVWMPGLDRDAGMWRLSDAATGAVYEREGGEIRQAGLYVDLPAWGFHLFEMTSDSNIE